MSLMAVTSTAAHAATLGSPEFAMSTNTIGATGVTYTWGLTTPTGGTVTSFTLGIPLDATYATGSTLPAPTVYGLSGCTVSGATISTAGNTSPLADGTVTVSTSSCVVPAGTSVAISIGGFKNPTVAEANFESSIGFGTDTGSAPAVPLGSDHTNIAVMVPESLTFTNSKDSLALLPIPGSSTPTVAPAVSLGVSTNASGGYTLSGCTYNSVLKHGTDTIPTASTGAATALSGANPGLGASASTASAGLTLSAANKWSATSSTLVVGYQADATSTSCSAPNEVIASRTNPTNGDTITLTNQVLVPASQPSGLYTGTIYYNVTPNY